MSIEPNFPLRIQLGLNHPLSDVPCLNVARKLELSEPTTFIQGYFSCAPTPELVSRLDNVNIQSRSVKIVASDSECRGPYDLIVINGEHSMAKLNNYNILRTTKNAPKPQDLK